MGVCGARVKPDIQGVFVLLKSARLLIEPLEEFFDRQGLPCLNAIGLHRHRNALQDLGRSGMECSGLAVHQKGHGHPPLTLTREGPVGTAGNHCRQACLPPIWIEGCA